jgi:hypothetical protein
MRTHYKSILAAILVLAWTTPALAQQSLTEEDVQKAFGSLDFLNAFAACFANIEHPEEVELVVIIDENGGASLSKTEPALLPQTTTCVSQAATKLSFPATGNAFEITYPIAVPESSGAAAGTTHPVTTAKPVYAVQPTTAVVVQDDSWKVLYSSGRRKVVVGAVLVGVGSGVLLLPGVILLAYGFMCESTTSGLWSSQTVCRAVFTIPGAILTIGGLIMVITGAISLSKGSRLKRKALQMKAGTAFIPEFNVGLLPKGGAAATLTWRF